jgi:hypothetical protein
MSDETSKTGSETNQDIDGLLGAAQMTNDDVVGYVKLTDEQRAAQKKRNSAVALSLIAFMALIFTITVLRLSQNIAAGSAG